MASDRPTSDQYMKLCDYMGRCVLAPGHPGKHSTHAPRPMPTYAQYDSLLLEVFRFSRKNLPWTLVCAMARHLVQCGLLTPGVFADLNTEYGSGEYRTPESEWNFPIADHGTDKVAFAD